MKTKYYIDTCIWRDYYENRTDRFRPLGEWSLFLLNKIIQDFDLIIISDFLLYELSLFLSKEEIKKLFEPYKNNLFKIKSSTRHHTLAKSCAKKYLIPKQDALHFVLALEHNAILVTRDQHFNHVSEIIEVKKPEDLI
ncbi:PIN domain-containing protein [Candidatus Woesearchaeota archaeon]|jgi:hypothetical protein|nr:PIN domain-containing protein [Candidatus Woesearchaeota archaeon]MBT5272350.1 PIN domain-containing protein [Candidatus Woesearchaeota archaeon]MBT6041318.1 PIN domain-containing protein [Candidatus Woesearchaeota archaeon]MBT6336622.1 PIN domain-containing protein [Candidatus Woesearchaeota archaeon]MBT7927512.1 PIN domain-containing protein [Candidatus Woesearchaeota archaeon]